jgi:hypothetical protein
VTRKTKVKYVPGGTRESKWKALNPTDKAYWTQRGIRERPAVKVVGTATYKDDSALKLLEYAMREGLELSALVVVALEEYFAVRGIELKKAELPDGQWAYYRQLNSGTQVKN